MHCVADVIQFINIIALKRAEREREREREKSTRIKSEVYTRKYLKIHNTCNIILKSLSIDKRVAVVAREIAIYPCLKF